MTTSYIQKFIFESLPIKGSMVILDDCWHTIASQRDYPRGLKHLIAELLAANILLTSNLKLDGKVICQVQDNPSFNLAVSECSNDYKIRATAKWSDNPTLQDYHKCLTSGRLVVSIDSKNDGNLYQSIISFSGDNLAQILNNYMLQSEQLRSWFFLVYTENKVAGFLLQQLPDVNNEYSREIDRIFMLGETLTAKELVEDNLEKIIHKLFNEDNVLVMPSVPVTFGCTCSKDRVADILRSLGKEELEDLVAEQGGIAVDCDYCNQKYQFSKAELTELVMQISIDSITPVSQQIH